MGTHPKLNSIQGTRQDIHTLGLTNPIVAHGLARYDKGLTGWSDMLHQIVVALANQNARLMDHALTIKTHEAPIYILNPPEGEHAMDDDTHIPDSVKRDVRQKSKAAAKEIADAVADDAAIVEQAMADGKSLIKIEQDLDHAEIFRGTCPYCGFTHSTDEDARICAKVWDSSEVATHVGDRVSEDVPDEQPLVTPFEEFISCLESIEILAARRDISSAKLLHILPTLRAAVLELIANHANEVESLKKDLRYALGCVSLDEAEQHAAKGAKAVMDATENALDNSTPTDDEAE